MIDIVEIMQNLDADAMVATTDPKVFVGCSLGNIDFKEEKYIEVSRGFNCNYSFNERLMGKTYRQMVFNSTDTKYRPWDKIIHAEENAVYNAIKAGKDCEYNTAIVTRYPCEKCAQLLIFKGIKYVYYGRETNISEGTARMFKEAGVEVEKIEDYKVDEAVGAEALKLVLPLHKQFIDLNNLK